MNSVQMCGGVSAVGLIKRRSTLGRQCRDGGVVSAVGVFLRCLVCFDHRSGGDSWFSSVVAVGRASIGESGAAEAEVAVGLVQLW